MRSRTSGTYLATHTPVDVYAPTQMRGDSSVFRRPGIRMQECIHGGKIWKLGQGPRSPATAAHGSHLWLWPRKGGSFPISHPATQRLHRTPQTALCHPAENEQANKAICRDAEDSGLSKETLSAARHSYGSFPDGRPLCGTYILPVLERIVQLCGWATVAAAEIPMGTFLPEDLHDGIAIGGTASTPLLEDAAGSSCKRCKGHFCKIHNERSHASNCAYRREILRIEDLRDRGGRGEVR
jgi:hypothetical protein